MEPTATALDAGDVLDGVVIDLAGVAVRLHASDADRAEAVASLFRHARATVSPAVGSVAFVADTVAIPAGSPSRALAYVDLWYEGRDVLWIRSGDRIAARSDRESVVVGGGAPTALGREFRFVCLLALTHFLAWRGRHLLHGAALAVDGQTVLVLGGSGTGKSTLAFAAYQRGWPVLADDAVLVCDRDGAVVVHGLPRPIAVAADVAVTRIRGGRPVPDDLRQRMELAPGTLTRTASDVDAVVLARGGDARGPSLEPVAGPEILRAILGTTISIADPALRPDIFEVAGALARLPRWSLTHGLDETRALADASECLDRLREELARVRGR